MKILIIQVSPACCYLSVLGSHIFCGPMFENLPCLCSSLSLRDLVSHPYKTADKIIVSYIFIFCCEVGDRKIMF